jgi:hypothetical protein
MATETINERIPVARVRDDLDAVIDHAQEMKQQSSWRGMAKRPWLLLTPRSSRRRRKSIISSVRSSKEGGIFARGAFIHLKRYGKGSSEPD